MRIQESALTSELQAALESEGMTFGLSPDEADALLRRRIGEKRFRRFCRTMDQVRAGRRAIHDVYCQFRSIRVMNCLMSLQAEVVLATNAAVIETSGVLELGSGRVGELGCLAGSVLRFLAQKRPTLNFLGFDRVPRILAAARTESPSNCQFVPWDYAKDPPAEVLKCDALLGALCIDFHNLVPKYDWFDDDSAVDGTKAYAEVLAPCFSNWRGIVNDGAHCTLVLRLSPFFPFSAMCHAAMITGWEPDYSSCRAAVAGDERFRVIKFVAGGAVQPSAGAIREMVSAWESTVSPDWGGDAAYHDERRNWALKLTERALLKIPPEPEPPTKKGSLSTSAPLSSTQTQTPNYTGEGKPPRRCDACDCIVKGRGHRVYLTGVHPSWGNNGILVCKQCAAYLTELGLATR